MIYEKLKGLFFSIKYVCFYYWYYKLIFGKINWRVRIFSLLSIEGGKNIYFMGKGIIINKYTWLAAKPLTGCGVCRLVIGSGTRIGHFNHIYCTQSIMIGNNVLTADKVYISDNLHGYKDIEMPIWKQPIQQLNPVVIGDGAWIGENVCIIGANVGRGSVIGANSVVTKDIPDYSVAVGIPAKVIKQYNFKNCQWEKV